MCSFPCSSQSISARLSFSELLRYTIGCEGAGHSRAGHSDPSRPSNKTIGRSWDRLPDLNVSYRLRSLQCVLRYLISSIVEVVFSFCENLLLTISPQSKTVRNFLNTLRTPRARSDSSVQILGAWFPEFALQSRK